MRISYLLLTLLFLCAPLVRAEEPKAKIDISGVVKGNNDFAFELYKQLAKKAKPDENIIFSPYSIQCALAMTYGGARGETAKEMAKVLHFDPDQDKFHPTFAELRRQLSTPKKGSKTEFLLANALWINEGMKVHDPFKQLMGKHYNACLYSANFSSDSENERVKINKWVEEQTKQEIKEVLPVGALSPDTVMVIGNALFMKFEWKHPFNKKHTTSKKFHLSQKASIEVPTMHIIEGFRYAENKDYELVELLSADEQHALLICLSKDRIRTNETMLKAEVLQELLTKMAWAEVDLSLPLFDIKYDVKLRDSFKELGLRTSFGSGANFLGIADRNIYLEQIYHSAKITIDEKGAKASAATIGAMRPLSGSINENKKAVVVDCPCTLLLQEKATKTIKFMLRLSNPMAPKN